MGKQDDFFSYVCQTYYSTFGLTKPLHAVCLLAIVPLAMLLDYGGEQMLFYLGKDLGDLIKVTLSKCRQKFISSVLHHPHFITVLSKPRSPSFFSTNASMYFSSLSQVLPPLNTSISRLRILKSTIIGKTQSKCCTKPS